MTQLLLWAGVAMMLAVTACGWALRGGLEVRARLQPLGISDAPSWRTLLGDRKLIWAWVLLLSILLITLASRLGHQPSVASLLGAVVGYGLMCGFVGAGAVFLQIRKPVGRSGRNGGQVLTAVTWVVVLGASTALALLIVSVMVGLKNF